MVLAETGEDTIAFCHHCDYAANVERAEVAWNGKPCTVTCAPAEKVATPNAHTVEEVAALLGVPASSVVKTMLAAQEQRYDAARQRLQAAGQEMLACTGRELEKCEFALAAANPLAPLRRGYALVHGRKPVRPFRRGAFLHFHFCCPGYGPGPRSFLSQAPRAGRYRRWLADGGRSL